ncbi:hypothetical protein [Desulfolithobacter sp.]
MQYIPSQIHAENSSRDWFEQRRDHFVRQVVDGFFHVFISFQGIYQVYVSRCANTASCADMRDKEVETVRRDMWERLTSLVGSETEKGPLWQLKDLCHRVWPETEEQDVSGSLLDWLVGSVFHEAMKLKENIYLLNSYGPAAFRMQENPEAQRGVIHRLSVLPPTRLATVVDARRLVGRIVSDVAGQLEQIGFLFGQANYILRMMMPSLGSNMLVVRLLVEQEDIVRRLWGEDIRQLLADMFSGDAAEGFCAAGRSYLAGQWYSQALTMYQRALEEDSACDEALAKVAQLGVIVRDHSRLLGL